MAKTMFVRPAEGRVVPDPEYGDELPSKGRSVPRNAYWVRRVNAKDVTEGEQCSSDTASVAEVAQQQAAGAEDEYASGAQ